MENNIVGTVMAGTVMAGIDADMLGALLLALTAAAKLAELRKGGVAWAVRQRPVSHGAAGWDGMERFRSGGLFGGDPGIGTMP
jgi:hypothetical protein